MGGVRQGRVSKRMKSIFRGTLFVALMMLATQAAAVIEVLGVNTTGTDIGVDITPNATANTEGSWATIGTTSQACKSLTIVVTPGTSTAVDYLLDIGTGATPDVVVSDLLLSITTQFNAEGSFEFTLPLAIATSTAIKARAQANGATQSAVEVAAICDSVGAFNYDGVASLTTYGATAADSGGIEIDAGATPDTKPATYTEITSSTSAAIKGLWLALGASNDFTRADDTFLCDLATGAASSEVNFVTNLPVVAGGGVDGPFPRFYGPFAVSIASTTRIAARCQSSTNTDGNRDLDFVIYSAATFAAAAGGGLAPMQIGPIGGLTDQPFGDLSDVLRVLQARGITSD